VKVIPGHGAISNLDDVRAFLKMLKETSAVVQKAIDRRQTLEQMKQAKILAPWEKFSGSFINTDAFIETLYNSLTGPEGQVCEAQLNLGKGSLVSLMSVLLCAISATSAALR
jgi:hypothetical protein